MKKHLYLFLVLLYFTPAATATVPEHTPGSSSPGFYFIENKGQWDARIRYKLNMGVAQLFAENDRLNYLLVHPGDLAERSHHHTEAHCNHDEQLRIRCHRFYVRFAGANTQSLNKPARKLSAYHNYFLGNDPSKWASEVGLFEEVFYGGLYPGIDLRLYESGGNIKYDFIVAAGADPAAIDLEYSYADKVFLKDGNLHIQTSVNEVVEQKPFAYQEINGLRKKVDCFFELENNRLRFVFPKGYDHDLPLIIDPVLIFASYSGASDDNWGTTATYDDAGNLYAGGVAFGDYPTTPGAFQISQISIADPGNMGISKFAADGRTLVYSTFIGGRQFEVPHSMIVNSRNELVIMGTSGSDDYPVRNAFNSNFSGGIFTNEVNALFLYNRGSDIVVTVLNAAGSDLVGSTYIGGGGNDGLHLGVAGVPYNYGDPVRGEVVLDADDNIYVASVTKSDDFPTTPGAFDRTYNGGLEDGVIFKLSSTASGLLWSTYLGGSSFDAVFSLKLNENGNVYTCGVTNSVNFPVTANALHRMHQGQGSVGIVTEIAADGSTLLSSTFLTGSDFAYFVELDEAGDVYVIGQASVSFYPVTPDVYSNAGSTLFLHKLDPDLSQTRFSTVLGNGDRLNGIWVPSAFLVDNCGRIYISGWGGLTNGGDIRRMPVSSDAFQRTTDGSDFYLMVLKPDATELEYGTYFGGRNSQEHVDGGTSRFDKKGIIYQAVCAGCGGNDDFPTNAGAYSRNNNASNCNLGVFKFDFQFNRIIIRAEVTPDTFGCAPHSVSFLNSTTGATDYFWSLGDNTTSTQVSPTHIYRDPGTYEVILIATSSSGCVEPDTAVLHIDVAAPPQGVNQDFLICEGDPLQLASTNTAPGTVYQWSDGSDGNSITVNSGGVFWVAATTHRCPQRDSFFVTAIPNGSDLNYYSLCEGQILTLQSSNGRSGIIYQWNDGSAQPTLDIDDTGTYWVIAFENGCEQIDTFIVEPEDIELLLSVLDINCVGQDSGYVALSVLGGTPPYNYALNNGNFENTAAFSGLVAGNYTVRARDINGCLDQEDFNIIAPPAVNASISGNLEICLGDSTVLIAHTNLLPPEIDTVIWTGIENSDCPQCLRQTVRPVRDMTYAVLIQSADGCYTVDSIRVIVEPKKPVYVPSAFSPNSDGINDEFVIYANAGVVANIPLFQIYDRWGELVFEKRDILPNDPAFGWNGVFRGKEMDPAVFVWYAQIDFIDDTSIQLKGDVTLVR